MAIITNTTTLTATQEENLGTLARAIFLQNHSDTFFHFSFEGTCLNFDSMNAQAIFEIHSEEGSFLLSIDLNSKNKGLKKTAKIQHVIKK